MTPPQTSIPPAANVLATLGTVFWCVQLVPQVWHNWKRKKTEGLPGSMMLLWAICSIPFGVYAIVQKFAIAIQIQPQVFGVLALINWGQTLFYNDGWSQRRATIAIILACVLFGGLEVLLIFTLQIPYSHGVGWPIVMIGIIAAILLAAGLVPPYWEMWKRQGRVIGINWLFLTIDWLGALFSLLAVVEQNTFDALGGSLYIIVMVLEAGIFLSHWIWLLRQKLRKGKGKDEEEGDAEAEADGEGDESIQAPDDAPPKLSTATPRENARDEQGGGGVKSDGENREEEDGGKDIDVRS